LIICGAEVATPPAAKSPMRLSNAEPGLVEDAAVVVVAGAVAVAIPGGAFVTEIGCGAVTVLTTGVEVEGAITVGVCGVTVGVCGVVVVQDGASDRVILCVADVVTAPVTGSLAVAVNVIVSTGSREPR
jgi:hypothetical protein